MIMFWVPHVQQLQNAATSDHKDAPVKIPAESSVTFFVRKWCQPHAELASKLKPKTIAGQDMLEFTFQTYTIPPPS